MLVSGIETAEIIKLVSNTFRDVQFAFANEVARRVRRVRRQRHEVISAGKLGYNRTNIPLPGVVGGPCLEKDPHILMESARTRGISKWRSPAQVAWSTSASREETVRLHQQRDQAVRPGRSGR